MLTPTKAQLRCCWSDVMIIRAIGILTMKFPSIDAFMDQIEHFLACKSVTVPTCNSWRFDTESHQNHYGSISLLLAVVCLKGTATGFWPWWDCTTDPLPTQAFCFAFWIGELFHFNGCSEFCVKDSTAKEQTSSYTIPAWQTEGYGLSSQCVSRG